MSCSKTPVSPAIQLPIYLRFEQCIKGPPNSPSLRWICKPAVLIYPHQFVAIQESFNKGIPIAHHVRQSLNEIAYTTPYGAGMLDSWHPSTAHTEAVNSRPEDCVGTLQQLSDLRCHQALTSARCIFFLLL